VAPFSAAENIAEALGVGLRTSKLAPPVGAPTGEEPDVAATMYDALPMLLNRLDNQLPLSAPGLPEKPSATARRFYYDTVGHGSVAALRCAVDAFGADRILPGSDYPVLLAFESYRDTFGYLSDAGLPDADLHDILTANVDQIFKEF